MKFDQRELEIHALAHLVSNPKAMDKMQTKGIAEHHFVHIESGNKNSYTKIIFRFILDYWNKSGGSLFSSYVLESKMNEYSMKDKSRGNFMTLWAEIEDADINENDLYEVITQLKNRHCLRVMTEMFNNGHESLLESGVEEATKIIQDKIEEIQKELYDIGGDTQTLDVSESAEYFESEYRKRVEHPELFRGIPCGLDNIDSKTFGFLPGQIIVFLAPSSGGKSVMLLNTAVNANREAKKNVLYMSFEMNSWLCLLRHISLTYEIPYSQIKDVSLSPEELKKIVQGMKKQSGGPYFEYDVNMEDPTPEYIDSRIRDLIATKGKPDLLVVDYIGNMTVRNPNGATKDWELQSKAITELFKMAKRYNIPIITAQQINRETIRDARKAKEANKFMSYDQAAVSGGQVLMHLCTYAIAMEPNKEEKYCIFHPVKMRDAWFHPFPVRMETEYNKVRQLTEEEQAQIMAMHAMASGQPTTSTKDLVKKPAPAHMPKAPENTPEQEDDFVPLNLDDEDMELDLSEWNV